MNDPLLSWDGKKPETEDNEQYIDELEDEDGDGDGEVEENLEEEETGDDDD